MTREELRLRLVAAGRRQDSMAQEAAVRAFATAQVFGALRGLARRLWRVATRHHPAPQRRA